MPQKYLEQYNRMLRWYKEFKKINNGKVHDRSTDFYQDVVYVFFQNCYHLKDWIINNSATPSLDSNVHIFLNKYFVMKLCHDICIGSKHLRINTSRVDNNTIITNKKMNLKLGKRKPEIQVNFYIKANNQKYNAFDIASKCVKKWNKFLQQENLL